MEKEIASIMSSPDEAKSMFDILRDLVQAADSDDPDRLVGGLMLLDSDIVRVCLATLVSITLPESIHEAEKEFMAEVFPTDA